MRRHIRPWATDHTTRNNLKFYHPRSHEITWRVTPTGERSEDVAGATGLEVTAAATASDHDGRQADRELNRPICSGDLRKGFVDCQRLTEICRSGCESWVSRPRSAIVPQIPTKVGTPNARSRVGNRAGNSTVDLQELTKCSWRASTPFLARIGTMNRCPAECGGVESAVPSRLPLVEMTRTAMRWGQRTLHRSTRGSSVPLGREVRHGSWSSWRGGFRACGAAALCSSSLPRLSWPTLPPRLRPRHLASRSLHTLTLIGWRGIPSCPCCTSGSAPRRTRRTW